MKLDGAFGIHAQALQLKARRAEVIAGNIANADTPGYKARDFDFRALLNREMGQPVRMYTTHQNHMQMEPGTIPPSQMSYRIPSQPSLDGNTVDSQIEHAAYAENALEYQASLRFLNGAVSKLRLAIKGQS
ncbi:flagellar basal body rod protein FlgB [Solemya velesiana gill symbiont]|uniref:Flagellar basal body rod protein FlgB n=1 Tax=Solemya velesiana gill symbiont TaxID=1918948 RepID=A0A1T2KY71_9GAMM|nr:flagellar basal body rod protein FlgB [Solemya velesiana gill symbiont]OOZ37710.1 flagellar basal-body rod protein FlgB [Solemya velesiana gill symbiont]